MSWDPHLYLQFGDERTRPGADLLSRIDLVQPNRIVDLGCGPGNSTRLLRQRWPKAALLGLDNSPEMIAMARQSFPEGSWMLENIAGWHDPESFDLVFSSAALQWVPNHRSLFPTLMARVKPGGVLAAQMPAHFASPLHRQILEVADAPHWRDQMAAARTAIGVEPPSFYYDLLRPIAARIELWETEYIHIMESVEAILRWIGGTGLRPFLDALTEAAEKEAFEDLLLDRLKQAYPPQKDGAVLFPFRRLFLVAHR